MPRTARLVVPNLPHHVTQRGNRKQKVFFCDEDRFFYMNLICKCAEKSDLILWAYCLMENHTHLIVVPQNTAGLAKGIGKAHQRYTRAINRREDWKGFLWQGRFHSYPLSERHLFAAIRYVEQNPVRAGIVRRAADYPWSSAKAHVSGKKDLWCEDFYLLKEIPNWGRFLEYPTGAEEEEQFKHHIKTGKFLQ
jgi:putative transposase